MTEQDRDEKFLDCAGRVLGQPGARQLLDTLRGFETIADIRTLVKATIPGTSTPPKAHAGLVNAAK
jgi:hypothetical protein